MVKLKCSQNKQELLKKAETVAVLRHTKHHQGSFKNISSILFLALKSGGASAFLSALPEFQPAKITASCSPSLAKPAFPFIPRVHLPSAAALPEVWLPGFGYGMELLDVFISQHHGREGLTLTHSSAISQRSSLPSSPP